VHGSALNTGHRVLFGSWQLNAEAPVVNLVPDDAEIRRVRDARRPVVGAKRKALRELASGDIIVYVHLNSELAAL